MILRSPFRRLLMALSGPSTRSTKRRPSRARTWQMMEALEPRMVLSGTSLTSINLLTSTPTDGLPVSWQVTFSQGVTGVDTADFTLAKTGVLSATITDVVPVSTSVYNVTATGVTGSGTLGLNLLTSRTINDTTGSPLVTSTFTGQIFTVDQLAPSVQSITASGGSSSTALFTATFSEPVTGVDATDFAAVTTGTGATSTTVRAVSQSVYTVTVSVSGVTASATLGLNLVDNGSIRDLASNPLASSTVSFATQPTFSVVGVGPTSVAQGDINGDGALDLAISFYASTDPRVLMGNGHGAFPEYKTMAPNGETSFVAIGDLNGDGKPDLVATLARSPTLHPVGQPSDLLRNVVVIALQTGTGLFDIMKTFATGTQPTSVALGDVNGDGKPDLAVTNQIDNTLSLLLGNGDGTFQPQQTFDAGSSPWSVAMGDVNGDGKIDLAITGSNVSIYLGNGNGTFQPRQAFETGSNPRSVAIGDLNGDGKPDLAVTNITSNTVSVLLGNGDGTFQAQTTYATGSKPWSVAIGDLNGDGKPDLAVANYAGNSVSIRLGNGDGTFQSTMNLAVANGPRSVALGDFNGDGKADIVAAGYLSPGSGSLLLNTRNGNFTGPIWTADLVDPSVQSINLSTPTSATTSAASVGFTATFSEAVTGVDLADFILAITGTTAATITQVTAVSSSVYTVTVSGITGAGTLGLNLVDNGTIRDLAANPLVNPSAAASFTKKGDYTTDLNPVSVALDFMNGDGILDLAVVNFSANNANILVGNSDGSLQAKKSFPTGSGPYSLAVGDVNGDGIPDMAAANPGGNTVSVLLGNGNGTFQAQKAFATGSRPTGVAMGDVNGDGKTDLTVANYGSHTVGVLLGNGDGTFQAQTTYATGSGPWSVTIGDVSGDGKADLAVANRGYNSVGVLLGNGNGTFGPQATFATGSVPRFVAMGDVNRDGHPDLAVANQGGNTLGILLGNGNGTFQTQKTFATGTAPYSVALGDFNGDGKPDAVVPNRTSNSISVFLGNGDGTFGAQTTFAMGSSPSSVAVGDMNNDGRPDLAVANTMSSTVRVMLNSAKGNFTGQAYTIQASVTTTAATTTNVVVATVVVPAPMIKRMAFVEMADQPDSPPTLTLTLLKGRFADGSDHVTLAPRDGKATFPLKINEAGHYWLRVTDSADTLIDNFISLTVKPAAARVLKVIEPLPTTVTAGTPITQKVAVAVEDAFGNLATHYKGLVTLTIGAKTYSARPSHGIARFAVDNLEIRRAGSYAVTVKAPLLGYAPATVRSTLKVTPAAASTVEVISTPKTGTAGTALGAVIALIKDEYGNVCTSDESIVSIKVKGGPGDFTPESILTAKAVAGVVTFSNLKLNTSGDYILVMPSGTLMPGESRRVAIAAAAATQLVVLQLPGYPIPGGVFDPVMKVALQDAFGNLVQKHHTVTLTLSNGLFANGRSFVTATTKHGVATFRIPGTLAEKVMINIASHTAGIMGTSVQPSVTEAAGSVTNVLSDSRLKKDISPLGKLPNGLTLYRFRYLWSETLYVGVMAQEVQKIMPDAVAIDASGFMKVNYGRIGIPFLTWSQWQKTPHAAALGTNPAGS